MCLRDRWTIFENTHEAIIDQQTFDLVQKIRGNVRRDPDGWGEAAPLTGVLYCADCGGKMYVHRTNNGDVYKRQTLGRIYVDDLEMLDVPDQVKPYFDYEAYGRDA